MLWRYGSCRGDLRSLFSIDGGSGESFSEGDSGPSGDESGGFACPENIG